jgi:hypothetical protein
MRLDGVFSDNESALPLPRLRGRVGVGVLPQMILPERIDFPHPPRFRAIAETPLRRSLSKDGRLWRPVLPRKRER